MQELGIVSSALRIVDISSCSGDRVALVSPFLFDLHGVYKVDFAKQEPGEIFAQP